MHNKETLLLTNCHVASMTEGSGYGALHDGAILVDQGKICWLGKRSDAPRADARHIDLGGRWVTPGLIDFHTHLVFGGTRAGEFEQRLNGSTYEQIARAGGGIMSTVAATRAATEEELVEGAIPRLRSLAATGVTTIEIKSGYGLDLQSELKMLRAARELESRVPMTVVTTFLGLHAVPPEFADRPDDYVDVVIKAALPVIAMEGLASAVDAYLETIAFSEEQVERYFAAAAALGLKPKLHADQLASGNGAHLASRAKALSADHLEYLDEAGAKAMASAGVAAVLLPGAFLTLRETKVPPVDLLRRAGVDMAVATDCNPGTSPMTSMLLAMNLGCTLFGLTPLEALKGATINAAKALDRDEEIGSIEPDKAADLAVWDIAGPAELSYWLGHSPLYTRFKGGVEVGLSHRERIAELEPGRRVDQSRVAHEARV